MTFNDTFEFSVVINKNGITPIFYLILVNLKALLLTFISNVPLSALNVHDILSFYLNLYSEALIA